MYTRVEQSIELPIEIFSKDHVLVCGLGGVGSHAASALIRSGITNLSLVDYDIISQSNLNRQIMAKQSNIGEKKTIVLKEYLLEINPHAHIDTYHCKITRENLQDFPDQFDYIIDAIDLVTHKLALYEFAEQKNIEIISAMGSGNHFDLTKIKQSTLFQSTNCPLARVLRKEARKRNLRDIPVIYSTEDPCARVINHEGRNQPGSTIFVPGAFGYALASYVFERILEKRKYEYLSNK